MKYSKWSGFVAMAGTLAMALTACNKVPSEQVDGVECEGDACETAGSDEDTEVIEVAPE